MKPIAGAPSTFGEIYLSWRRQQQGLALATIGHDYYDLDLLIPNVAISSSAILIGWSPALRCAEVAGPRRFTLFFIPGHGDRRRTTSR